MTSHTLLAALASLMLALAGCASDSSEPTEAQQPESQEPDQPDSGQQQPEQEQGPAAEEPEAPSGGGNESAPNTAPEGSLSVSALEVTVPANVTYMMSGTDADGDALSWTLDVDGDGAADSEGSSLPFNFTFSFTDAGNYTATFVVTDGDASVEKNLTVVALEPADDGPLQVAEGSWHTGGMAECAVGEYTPEADGVLYSFFEVDPATWGLPFTAQLSGTVPHLTGDLPVGGWGVDFVGDDLSYMESNYADADGAVSGTVAQGAAFGAFWSCLGGAMSGTYAAG